MEDTTNLLYNITNRDPIYNVVRRNISYLLPEDLKDLYDTSLQIQIIGTDSFFIHYSVAPMLIENHRDRLLETARSYFNTYMRSDNYYRIKEKTVLDEELSLVYAVELTRVILELLIKKKEHSKKPDDNNHDKGNKDEKNGDKGDNNGEEADENKDNNEPSKPSYGEDEDTDKAENNLIKPGSEDEELRKALTEASNKAEKLTEKAKAIKDIMDTSGASLEIGDLKKLVNLANDLLEVRETEQIITMAIETVRELPKSFHFLKQEDPFGDELKGYGKTRRIEKALARELALPEDIFYYKLVSEGVLKKEKEASKEGALYVVLDKSGSMSGYKMIWSRSIAIALHKMARIKKKEFYLRLFDSQVYPAKEPLKDNKKIIELLLTAPTNGGTRITNALETALKDLINNKKDLNTDTIILITDGEDHVSIDEKKLFKNNIQLITIMVGGDNTTLKEVSHAYYNAALTIDGALTLIRQTDKVLLTKLSKPFLKHA